VYKRYASLFFCFAVDRGDNELGVLEVIHRLEMGEEEILFEILFLRYVEVLDKYFGSVCELDIIFNFEKAYYILDELILGGEMQVGRFYHLLCFLMSHDDQETSKKAVLSQIEQEDKFQEEEIVELALKDIGLI
jgi:AP-1 complex subunit sigma 1/2